VVLDGKGYQTDDASYATLPSEVGLLDDLAVGTQFTAVGYGQQAAYPDGTPADAKTKADLLRMIAEPVLNQYYGDFALLLSNNSKTGGTCFGDSGGPIFYDGMLVAVTSFGVNETCAGHGGVYRLDTADDLEWLYNAPEFERYI